MRLLANENIPGQLVESLRDGGANVLWIAMHAPGISDREVLAIAIEQNRILLISDTDFGELARSADLPPECDIILFRMRMPQPGEVGAQLSAILLSRMDWTGHLSVVEQGRIRTRLLRTS